jgi:hypothetical protein
MELELYFFSAFCETSLFTINYVDADYEDFGEKYDRDTKNAEDHGCGYMQFTRIEPKLQVLIKYGISETEYFEIAEKLESGLSFRRCRWCV